MAARRCTKNEELNSIFRSLAERGKDGEIYSECSDLFRGLPQKSADELEQFIKNVDAPVMFCPYGSEAENLKCHESHDLGDIDIMIFPYSDNLMIEEERLEYSLENPLHVRIRGVDHPVLQSCLVGDTVYVATSALKNFHPAIFGPGMLLMVEFLSFYCQNIEEEGLSFDFNAHLKNNTASQAITIDTFHLFGTISERREMLKEDSHNFPINEIGAQAEFIAHFLCVAKGIDYTRENAKLLNDFLLFTRDISNMVKSFSFFAFLPEIVDRFKKLNDGFQRIKKPLQHHALQDDNHHGFMPQQIEEDGGQKSRANFVRVPSVATGGLCQNITPQNFDVDGRSPEMVESPSSQSTLKKELTKTFHHLLMPKEATEDDFMNSNREGKHREHMSTDIGKKEHLQIENEKRELERRYEWWTERMFGPVPLKRQLKHSEPVKSGYDFIPSFKSRGWPKVAREWIKRERKWPSPNIVDKVVQEGFHLVVKAPKNNGNLECDFRISFSHAEYLLSQGMNDIQRECYRCLKRYHRTFLSTEPKSLVSFHLKNIFLGTIEETGADMWNESNRTECMMKLLRNLLKALTEKDLRHFFVRSCNLFGEDYIENREILECLADKVEEIIDDPVRVSTQLIQKRQDTKHAKMKESVPKRNVPRKESTLLSVKPAPNEQPEKAKEIPSKERHDTQLKSASMLETEETQESCSAAKHRYHELKDIYEEATKKLIEVAFYDASRSLEAMDPLERSSVEDLRELVREYGLPVSAFPRVFDAFWHRRAYYWVWISPEQDIRLRVLVAVKGLLELLKYYLKEENFCLGESYGALEALLNKMLHPCAQYPSHFNDLLPPSDFLQFMHMFSQFAQPQEDRERSSVEKVKEFVRKDFDLNHPFSERLLKVLDLVLDPCSNAQTRTKSDVCTSRTASVEEFSESVWEDFDHTDPFETLNKAFDLVLDRAQTRNKSDKCHGLLGLVEGLEKFMKSELKKVEASQGYSEKPVVDFSDKFFELIKRSAREAQQNEFHKTDNIPLD